jgi:hypothetical protein
MGGDVFLMLLLLTFVVIVRLVSRRWWVADVLGALAFSVQGVILNQGPIAGTGIAIPRLPGWLWMLRRLGCFRCWLGLVWG